MITIVIVILHIKLKNRIIRGRNEKDVHAVGCYDVTLLL